MSEKPSKEDLKGKRITNMRKKDDKIFKAATALFAKKGFDTTKMSEVAKKAGVAVGTIYLRYPNKHALLKGVLESYENKFVHAMTNPEIHTDPYPQRFENIFGAILETAANSPELPAVMQLAYHVQIEDWIPGEMVKGAIKTIIAESQEKGDLRQDVSPIHVAAISHGMVEGVMRQMMLTKDDDIKSYVKTLVDVQKSWLMP